MVAAPLDDSSSGWAWTAIKRRPAIVTPTLPGSAVRGPPHSMDVRAAVPPGGRLPPVAIPSGHERTDLRHPDPGPPGAARGPVRRAGAWLGVHEQVRRRGAHPARR